MAVPGYDQTPSTTPTDQSNTSQSFADRLGILKSRLTVAKSFCKKPQEAWNRYIDEYNIEDIKDVQEIRDKIHIPTIFRQVESDLPAIFDDQPDLFLKGKGQYRAFDAAFGNTYDWLWDAQDMDINIEDAATYFLLLGMAMVESPWITKTKTVQQPVIDSTTGQQTMQEYQVPTKDQPQLTVGDPFKYYFSPETKFSMVLTYDVCPYYFKEYTMTVDEIKARFGKEVDPTGVLNTADADTNTEISTLKGNEAKDDMKRETVYEYYGCLPENLAPQSESSWSYDKDYHIWFTQNEELLAEECKYPTKPLLILGNYGLANKFFRSGDAKYLIPLNQELQQYRQQILKYARRLANPKAMLPNEADIDEAAFADPNPGRVVKYSATAGVKPEYMNPPQLGREVFDGVNLVKTDLEQAKGSFSLSQGSSQSEVRTPRGIQVFSEAADRNVARKKRKIARFIREIVKFQFQECSQNWNPQDPRVVDIVTGGINDSQTPINVAQVLQILGDENVLAKVDIEVESLSVNKVQMKQDSLDLFDLASKFPQIFNLQEMAKDVLQNGFGKKDADRYLANQQQQQQYYEMMKMNRSQVRATVAVDGTDPVGAQLLENEGLLQPGQAQPLVQESQQLQQQANTSANVPYQELPMEGKLQKAAQAGIQLDPISIARQDHLDQAQKAKENQMKAQALQKGGTPNGIRR